MRTILVLVIVAAMGGSGNGSGSPREPNAGAADRKTSVRRRAGDLVALGAGAAVLVGSMAAASAPLSDLETDVFRSINELPDGVRPFIWPLMQYGTFITIPLLSVVALGLGQRRLAVAMAVSGIGVYLLARFVKLVVDRPRPAALLDGVSMREVFQEGSLGFPSGHAAVAAALVVACAAYLSGPWLWVSVALSLVVPVGRIYVAAHLPLDVIGGAALGVVAASATHLALGVPLTRRTTRLLPSFGASRGGVREPGG